MERLLSRSIFLSISFFAVCSNNASAFLLYRFMVYRNRNGGMMVEANTAKTMDV